MKQTIEAVDDRNAAPMAVLSRAIELKCDTLNVVPGGQAIGRVGCESVQLGDSKEFFETYGHLVPEVGDSATVLRSRAPDGDIMLRMCHLLNREIGVHLLWR